jgi:hypothetical protein
MVIQICRSRRARAITIGPVLDIVNVAVVIGAGAATISTTTCARPPLIGHFLKPEGPEKG